MTPISVRAKQNLQSVKMGLCPYVLFFGPGKLRFWLKMNMIPFFSTSTKDMKITFGANLNAILTGTFGRKKRKKCINKESS